MEVLNPVYPVVFDAWANSLRMEESSPAILEL